MASPPISDDINDQEPGMGWRACHTCDGAHRPGTRCKARTTTTASAHELDQEREQPSEAPVLRRLLTEGARHLTLEQTRQLRVELSAIAPTTRTARHDTWRLEVELESGGCGEVRVVLPRDRAACGSLTWSPDGVWVDESVSQLEEPEAADTRESNGGRAIAAELLAKLKARS